MQNPETDIKPKPNCVIVDANSWLKELLFKSAIGETLVYTLGRQGAFLGFPEIIETEVRNHGVRDALEALEELKKWSRIVNSLLGFSAIAGDSTESEARAKIDERLSALKPILIPVQFTLEHAKAALEMVNSRLPPNGEKNQQFKDSAIWQAILTLLPNYSMHFVTDDRGFFENRDTKKGLATNLANDCSQRNGSIEIHSDVATCLAALAAMAEVNEDRILELILPSVRLTTEAEAKRHKYALGELLSKEIKAFQTSQQTRLAVDYKMTFQYDSPPPVSSETEFQFLAITHGSCYYNTTDDLVTDHSIDYVTLGWKSPSGRGMYARDFGKDGPFRRPVKYWEY